MGLGGTRRFGILLKMIGGLDWSPSIERKCLFSVVLEAFPLIIDDYNFMIEAVQRPHTSNKNEYLLVL